MDIQIITTLITSVGFPIAACCYMFKLLQDFNKLSSDFLVTLKGIEEKLGDIDSRLDKLENKED